MLHKILVVTSLLALPQLAAAHAHLKKAEPKENSVVSAAPQKLVLSFSEPLETTMSTVAVKDSAGHTITSGPVHASSADAKTVEVALKNMNSTRDVYEVSWKAVSRDTHKMVGNYKFTVDPQSK